MGFCLLCVFHVNGCDLHVVRFVDAKGKHLLPGLLEETRPLGEECDVGT